MKEVKVWVYRDFEGRIYESARENHDLSLIFIGTRTLQLDEPKNKVRKEYERWIVINNVGKEYQYNTKQEAIEDSDKTYIAMFRIAGCYEVEEE